MFEAIVGIVCFFIPVLIGLWMFSNWETHTTEWREERLIQWLKRPLPTLKPQHRKRVTDAFPSEEWSRYPYLMIDAICKYDVLADEVVKWAIYYTVPKPEQDEEWCRILNVRPHV